MGELHGPAERPWGRFDQPAPEVSPWRAGKITVNKDNVLQVARIFADESDQLYQRIERRAEQMRSEPAWGDPVSEDMAEVLNELLIDAPDSYTARARQYAENLRLTADELVAVARSYGFTDEEIERALGGRA
ncbi:hypothetical protein [Goodfellowiella coeruleoviolacea]|uniref:PE domain-containing protein n=1 Tax=Goodfellowiella coeruleoviolacea TaxID=334858 RepID=A0AAE3G9F4_9PSEU|nr:hypothetical protein [Goodfellowiella coeruleoviolacea]MCP2164116.1 hypothetical protein [Goodfellowiella coeruleoviolacea]